MWSEFMPRIPSEGEPRPVDEYVTKLNHEVASLKPEDFMGLLNEEEIKFIQLAAHAVAENTDDTPSLALFWPEYHRKPVRIEQIIQELQVRGIKYHEEPIAIINKSIPNESSEIS